MQQSRTITKKPRAMKERKQHLRMQILRQLQNQKEGARARKSRTIQRKLFVLPQFKAAKTILFYLSFDGEVDTYAMITKAITLGKRIAVPVIRARSRRLTLSLFDTAPSHLHRGPHGILQPRPHYVKRIALSEVDLIVVPGVAFDKHGNRLGRGLGYYDRFLRSVPKRTPTVGLAFDFQVLKRLPVVESHDFSVNTLLFS